MKSTFLVTLGIAALATANALPPAHAQSYTAQTIMSGLYNPHGLAFDASGALYVAEAGVGGMGATIVNGGGDTVSYGETGGLSRLQNGVQTRLMSNLPSLATRTNGAPGGGSTGLHDIVFANGAAYGLIGFGADPALRDTLTQGGALHASQMGSLVQFNLSGTPTASVVTDLAAYEKANNPDKAELNSNPFGMTALRNGGFAVADAGANDILLVNSAGAITSSVVLPPYPNTSFPAAGGPTYQSVPTAVTEGANGDLYVSELGGYPFTVGGAHIDVIRNGALLNSFGGFTNLTDVTYYNGELYALQLSTNGISGAVPPGPGELLQIDPNTGASQVLYNGLSFPGGLVVGSDGAFYVSNNITSPGGGSVLRIAAVPEPGSVALLAGMGLTGAGFLARRKRARRKRTRLPA